MGCNGGVQVALLAVPVLTMLALALGIKNCINPFSGGTPVSLCAVLIKSLANNVFELLCWLI